MDKPNKIAFPFDTQVAVAIRHPRLESLRVLAERITATCLSGLPSLASALLLYAQICMHIDQIKVRVLGVRAPTDTSNALMRLIAALFVKQMSSVSDKDLETVNEAAGKFGKSSTDPQGSWLYPKMLVLANFIAQRLSVERFVDGLVYPLFLTKGLLDVAKAELPDFKKETRAIMQELMTLRRYGVKSSFFQDGMLHAPDDAWVLVDPSEYTGQMSKESANFLWSPDVLSVIFLAPRKELKRVAPEVVHEETEAYQTTLWAAPFSTKLMWTIDGDANIDCSFGMNLLPVEDVFRAKGKELEYEALLMSQVLRLYDLLVPIQMVRDLPSLPSRQQAQGLLDLVRKSKVEIPDFLVPRIRLLENPKLITERLEEEVEQAETETRRRSPREHTVEWFVRPLPKDHHPSPEARARALAKGIQLAENETFVKSHKRGKGDPIQLHKAKIR